MYYSQCNQDRYLNEQIFINKRHGSFIDIGAHDGITLSNTYFFEKELGWNGICIEPNPVVFEKLIKNRNCICENCCIAEKEEFIDFLSITGYSEMLSGIMSTYDDRHIKRIERELQQYGGTKNIIKILASPLHMICKKHNMYNFDFCSIDTEGAEEYIIKNIDFDNINIQYFVIENNYGSNEIRKFLSSKGYIHIITLESDDVFKKS
jgi:FkbM family methyltransferase